MSLYNQVFGINPYADILLLYLGTQKNLIVRFRDCFVKDIDGKLHICIYTRTGGNHRKEYRKANADMKLIRGFVNDEDDPRDPTYARFYYVIPENAKLAIDLLSMCGAKADPVDMWHDLQKKIQEDDMADATVLRAMTLTKGLPQYLDHVMRQDDK